jgi:hypothetical protein
LRVFVSYSSRDRLDALRLKEIVESGGHDVWMDLFDIRPAARLAAELEQGVVTADVLCLLLSPTAVASPWVREELRHALAAEAKGLRVMPVILRPAPIPDELADHVAVDATRGLDDAAVASRILLALGGTVDEGVLLDQVRRGELADRAAVADAERAFPAAREALDRAADAPVRELRVSVDQDTWPDGSGSVIEIVLAIDIFQGSLSILLAPYVEGHTWLPGSGLDERPPGEFFAATKPRVDARLLWAGRVVTAGTVQDGTDLGEQPLAFTFSLAGDEYTGEERATTTALLTRFELPSLRELVDRQSTVDVWLHHPGDAAPERVDPAVTDLRLRLEAPLRQDEMGIHGFRLWSHHDRADEVLWRAPALQACHGDLEREALLSLYRTESLRAQQTSQARRERIAATIEHGERRDDEDRWAGFRLLAGRASVPRLRGQLREAVEHAHEAVGLIEDFDPATLDYARAFGLLGLLTQLVNDLSGAQGTPEAIAHYSDMVVGLARQLGELHPGEPDYRRALARNQMQRAQLHPGTPSAADDVREAVAAIESLVRDEPLPWRVEEAGELRRTAESLLEAWGAAAGEALAPPTA